MDGAPPCAVCAVGRVRSGLRPARRGVGTNKGWQLAQAMGYGNYYVNHNTRNYVDDHYFVNTIAKIPMGVIINRPNDMETLFVKHWHTVEDTIDKIDPRTLRAVGQVLLAAIYREDAGLL